MKKILLILICFFSVTHYCICQLGPTLGDFEVGPIINEYEASSLFFQ